LQIDRSEAASSFNLPSAICHLQFEVRDTGIGIPRDQQERIFRAFEQEDTSTTRNYEGTGMGLTIASQLVALMGGQITVDSEPGRGSIFAFTAQFGLQPHPRSTGCQSVLPPVVLRDVPALIVDDNATNRRILEEWLRGWQMKAGGVASELEDQAAQGRLEEAAPLVARLETMARELMRLVCGLSLAALRDQAAAAAEPGRTAGA
jgi:hypothetical protein